MAVDLTTREGEAALREKMQEKAQKLLLDTGLVSSLHYALIEELLVMTLCTAYIEGSVAQLDKQIERAKRGIPWGEYREHFLKALRGDS